jgi:hypothetical protein
MVIGSIVANDLLYKERKDEIDWYLPINGKEFNNIKVKLYYDLGGMNYFSGSPKRRGFYISIQPVSKSETSESMTLLGKDSGGYVFVEEAKRFNRKRLLELVSIVPETAEPYVEAFKHKLEVQNV